LVSLGFALEAEEIPDGAEFDIMARR
jgi:hypothetical protein